MILDTDAYIYDAANFVTNERTDGRTDKAILGVGCELGKSGMSLPQADKSTKPTNQLLFTMIKVNFQALATCNIHTEPLLMPSQPSPDRR